MNGAFTVTVEGAVLSGERSGEGTPLVLVHGMAGDRHEWDGLRALLPSEPPTLAYDLRGFGRSSQQEGIPFSHAADLLALFDQLAIARAPVLGLSMGGGIALNFALDHPERVSRLVLISPAIVGWQWSDEWKALWRGVSGPGRDGDMALARARWLAHPMFDAVRETPAADHLLRTIEAYHGRQWVHDDQRQELPDLDRLHMLAAPTLLLTGERDFADLRLIADLIEAAAPDVTRTDFAKAGHMLHLERPREVADAISAFLD